MHIEVCHTILEDTLDTVSPLYDINVDFKVIKVNVKMFLKLQEGTLT